MEYEIEMKDVQAWVAEEGFGMQRWDTGHRRWDVDAGHGMQK